MTERPQTLILNDSTRVRITWDNAALARLERSPTGPVVRDLIRRGNAVADAARRQIPLGHVGVGGRAARGGRLNLRDTVHVRLVHRAADVPTVRVGSEDPIAYLHHEGTRPHVIVPRRASVLVFWSNKSGRVIYNRRVLHPGTGPNRYLTDNLHLAVQ